MRLRQAVLHPMLVLKTISTGDKKVDKAASDQAADSDIKNLIAQFATGSTYGSKVAEDIEVMLKDKNSHETAECPVCFEVCHSLRITNIRVKRLLVAT